jgi:hypothetical protein
MGETRHEDTLHLKRQRLSGWSSDCLRRLGGRWKSLAFPDRLFTAGMISIDVADRKLSRIASHGRIGSGTKSRTLSWRWSFTDVEKYFVSEPSVYSLLKAHGLIASPAYIVIKASEEFRDKTTAPNQLWQTDFAYLEIMGWAGTISPRCWTTSRASSSPGSSAPP